MVSKEKLMDVYVLKRKGLSINAICRQTGLNWRTVAKYLSGDVVRKPYDSGSRASILAPYYPVIETWLDDDDYTATWIYDRLKLMGYEGGYDVVKKKVRELKEKLALTAYIRFETEPGRQAQVDLGDYKVADENGDTIATVYLFSMVMGYSRKPYHEFMLRRDMTSFLDCHIHAFEHFGGVPQEILYDRMKNVLIRQLAGKLEWNREFYSFCLHYKFQPRVAPPYAAWVKGKVERPFHYVRENFWRGYEYRDMETANRDLHDWMVQTDSRVHGTTKERIDHRFERERAHLHPVPEHRYDTSLKVYRKVRKDCTVVYEGNYYVLPHRTVGKSVLLKVKEGMLGAFLDDELLVSYRIPDGKGHLVQDERFYRELRNDITQIRRKYHQGKFQKGKAKKTLGIVGGTAQTITVSVRSMDEYMNLVDEEA